MQYDTIMYVSDIYTVKVRKQGRSKENSHNTRLRSNKSGDCYL